ncbi:hypothetical protein BaRGS_00039583, partial [Batillaria attramentaria]
MKGAEFEFPSLTGSVLTVDENTTIALPFNLTTTDDCNLGESFQLQVFRQCKDKGSISICSHLHDNENCIQPVPSPCSCDVKPWTYTLHNNVTREDNCTWTWSTSTNKTERKEKYFSVL